MEVDTGTVNLVSKEGDTFPVDIEVARMSELVKGMLEEGKLVARRWPHAVENWLLYCPMTPLPSCLRCRMPLS